MSMTRPWMASAILAGLLLSGGPVHAAEEDARRKPPTQVTEKLSAKTYEQIEAAQAAMEAKRYGEAERILEALRQSAGDSLNDYEKAQVFNFLAAVHYEQEDYDATIADYQAITRIAGAPEQLRTTALFRLAQLYFVKEDYARSISQLDQWMGQVDSVRPEAHMLKAQAYYQMGQFKQAKAPIIHAMREAKARGVAMRENWMALLRAVYYETGDYANAVKTLEILIERWPRASYYSQLAGMYGLAKDQKKQLYVMHAARLAGLLESESDLLNTARLYMAEDAPYPAIELLEEGMEAGTIQRSASNIQLLAQALGLAREYERQIPVLKQAAAMTGDGKQYVYLGQAQLALYDWAGAAESLKQGLAAGGIERPGSVYMQLGTAYYNQKRFGPALQAFKSAGRYPDFAKQSSQWVRFVSTEIEREKALKNL